MAQHSKLVDGLTNETISPATANLQREIRAILQEILESEGGKHYNFETQAITLGVGGLGRGVNLACKDVQIATNGTDVQVIIVDSADSDDDATTQGFLLSSLVTASPLLIKVDNIGRLRFIGSAAAVVYILARK